MWTIEDIKCLFELAKFPEDFCSNEGCGTGDTIVFGGWNRVYLYPNGSILVSKSHCSKNFLQVCKDLDIETI